MAHAVRHADSLGVDLSALTLAQLREVVPQATDAVLPLLTLEGSVAARNHLGGTAPVQVRAQVARWKAQLA